MGRLGCHCLLVLLLAVLSMLGALLLPLNPSAPASPEGTSWSHPPGEAVPSEFLSSTPPSPDVWPTARGPEDKIEPELLHEARSKPGELIPVIVILGPQPQWRIAREIKQRYASRLDALLGAHREPTRSLAVEVKNLLTEMRRAIYEAGLRAVRPLQVRVESEIIRLGGKVRGQLVFVNAIAAALSYEAMLELARSPLVAKIIRDRVVRASLNISVPTIRAPTWWSHGYTGSPFRVAILDTGIDKDHPALRGRVVAERSFVDGEDPDDYNGHGTHVAGIVASQDSTYKGVAPGAYLINAKCLSSSGSGYWSWVAQAAEWAVTQAGADVLNASLGDHEDNNGESSEAKFVDALTSTYDVIWVNAAGNDGPSSSTVCVPADAYNCISVGAMNDHDTTTRGDDTLCSFSSRGPTGDGRIKPEVVAPGSGICSCNNDWESGPDFVYGSGTSMAAPHVSGAVALVWSYSSSWHPVAVKALLLNSADDLGPSGPDNDYGYGYINLEKAWNWRSYVVVGVVSEGQTRTYYAYLEAGQTLKVTLVWERNAHYYNNWRNYDVYPINNLDLYVYDPNGNLVGSSTRTRDNVEQVVITASTSGYYQVKVYGANVDNVDHERLGLAANVELYTSIPDDDTQPPQWSNPQDDGDIYDTDQTGYLLQIDWTDESGIAGVWFRYKFGEDGQWSDWYEGTHVGGDTYQYEIPRSVWTRHVGQTVYWQSKAVDADDDYPGDSMEATSDVFTGGLIMDDDDDPPDYANPQDSGDIPDNSTEDYVLRIDWTDENDIAGVWFRYKFGPHGEWSDWFEGTHVAGPTYEYRIPRSVWSEHIGEVIYWQSKAMDADDDREGDGAVAVTDVFTAGRIVDDDTDPPDWAGPSCTGDLYDSNQTAYVLQINWTDESGIANVWFRYKFGEDGEWSDWYEGTYVGDGVYRLEIPHDIWAQHVGLRIYWQSKAVDADDEGPNDGAVAISDVFTGGLIMDDDAEGPEFHGTGFSHMASGNAYRLLVNVSDPSGISTVVFFYRFGENGTWCGPLNATGHDGPLWWLDLAEDIWASHEGEVFYWYAVAYDADDDRPGDSAPSAGPVRAAFYLDVRTEPEGIPLPEDCGRGWYANGSLAYARCYSVFVEDVGTRYVFQSWSGDATGLGNVSDPIVMDRCKVAVASYLTQHRFGVVISGLPEGMTFTFAYSPSYPPSEVGVARSGELWLSNWLDNGSLIYLKVLDRAITVHEVRYVFVSWNTSSPFCLSDFIVLEASFKTQYLVSLVFTTEDGSRTIRPSEVWLNGSWPNCTLVRLKGPVGAVWLDLVNWTLVKVVWGGTNVAPPELAHYVPAPGGTWAVRCRVYWTALHFVDADGEPLRPLPSSVELLAPNGTAVVIPGARRALMQNGTFLVLSVIWEGTDVHVEVAFDPSSGEPVLPCRVYSVMLGFLDADGHPIKPPSSYRLVFPNGTELELAITGFRCQEGPVRLVLAVWQSSQIGALEPYELNVTSSGTYWFRLEVFNPTLALAGPGELGGSTVVLRLPNGTVRAFQTDEEARLTLRVQKGTVEVLKAIRPDGYVAFVFKSLEIDASTTKIVSLWDVPFEHPLVAQLNEPLISLPVVGPYFLAFDRLVMGYGSVVLIVIVLLLVVAAKAVLGRGPSRKHTLY